MNSNSLAKEPELKNGTPEDSDPFRPEQPAAARETLSTRELKRYREEVIEEIEEHQEPKKRPPIAAASASAPAAAPPFFAKSERLMRIENILEEDLEDAYFKMEPERQKKFKAEGEKAAAQIERLLAKTRVKTHKVFKIILRWLRIIPGINRYFLRQEAKIKTDKIIKL